MSNRDLAIQLINNTPEYKLGLVVAYLQGLNADEAIDDAFCEQLADDYENSDDTHKQPLQLLKTNISLLIINEVLIYETFQADYNTVYRISNTTHVHHYR